MHTNAKIEARPISHGAHPIRLSIEPDSAMAGSGSRGRPETSGGADTGASGTDGVTIGVATAAAVGDVKGAAGDCGAGMTSGGSTMHA